MGIHHSRIALLEAHRDDGTFRRAGTGRSDALVVNNRTITLCFGIGLICTIWRNVRPRGLVQTALPLVGSVRITRYETSRQREGILVIDGYIEFIVRNDGIQTRVGHNLRDNTIVGTVAQHCETAYIIRALERWCVVELFARGSHDAAPGVGIGGVFTQLPLILVVRRGNTIAQRRSRPDVDVGGLRLYVPAVAVVAVMFTFRLVDVKPFGPFHS